MDISDRKSHLAVIDEACNLVEETRLATTKSAFLRYFGERPPARVALEASTHSPWISRLLEDCGHEVLVANPRRLQLIWKSDSKNDRTDAELLARLARIDPKILSPVQHRGEQVQLDLSLIRARDNLVGVRTNLINFVRGTVKTAGARLPKCSTPSFAVKAKEAIPKGLRRALAPILRQIKQATKEIAGYDKQIEAVSKKRYPETALLQQVDGVGPITSLCFVLTIEAPLRFRKSRTVGAFLGLRSRSCLTNGISQSDLCAFLMKSFATEDTEITEMKERVEDSQTEQILAAAIEVHRHLGPGLLESIYEEALCHELALRSIPFEQQ
ncbi:MAG: GxxExxY protein, partial [Planctomycetota bacterium]